MDAMLSVGGVVDRENAESLIGLFDGLFKAAYETRMEQETVRCAIDAIGRIATVEGLTVQNCTFTGDTK